MTLIRFLLGFLVGSFSVIANPLTSESPHAISDLNLAQLAGLSTNIPYLDNSSLLRLYEVSQDVLNGTRGDSVLFDLTDHNITSPYKLLAVSTNSSIQQDLMSRFRIYFVNGTEYDLPASRGWYIDATTPQQSKFAEKHRASFWNIATNFFKNQVNAVVGAFMTPFKVGAKAMMSSSIEHAQAVASGSAYAFSYTEPILMKSIGLPNSVAQYAVNLNSRYQDNLDSYGDSLRNSSNLIVDSASKTVQYGVENAQQLTVDYVAKPTAAFVGTNLALAGTVMSKLGSGMSNGAIHLSIFGSRLSTAGDSAVSAGSSAIVWALDPSVVLPGEHQQEQRLPQLKSSNSLDSNA